MSKKEIGKRYFVFLIGLFINSLGVSFVTKANLGTSPISSIPYVLSLRFHLTLGEFTIIFSLLLIALQIALLGKRFQKASLLQIPVSIVFGYFIDLCMALLGWLRPESDPYRALALLVGCVILGFGVYIEVIADVVMLPGEAFVKAVTLRFRTEFGVTKICFDASMTILAGALSVALFRRLRGVGLGTVLAALLVGAIARSFGKALKGLTAALFGTNTERAAAGNAGSAVNTVITIGREYGSGGREIGKRVAQQLNMRYYDSDLLEMVAKESGKSERTVEQADQKLTGSFLFDLYTQSNLYASGAQRDTESVWAAEQRVIRRLASEQSCVIVGRLANFILCDTAGALHVYLCAEKEDKIRHVMQRDGLPWQAAEHQIKTVERERREHCRLTTGKEWGAAKYYDVTFNTSVFGSEQTAAYIIAMSRAKTAE